MNDPDLGTIARVDPRSVWGSEPHEFTPWLRENIDLLGKALGLEIDAGVQQEVAVGLFSADLLGTDVASNAGILIENQLEATDHDHLGKLLTYAAGLDAGVLVWVSTAMREEHRQALTWLNERSLETTLFFGVEIELLSVDGSKPAPNFKVAVAPNEWQKAGTAARVGRSRTSERNERYKAFWAETIRAVKSRDGSFTAASPERAPAQSWCSFPMGRTGFQDNLSFGWEEDGWVMRAELYIDVGDKDQNKAAFDALEEERVSVEAEFGEALLWTRRDDIRASRIYVKRPGSIDASPDELEELRSWAVDRAFKIREALGPRVKGLALPDTV